MYLDGTHLLCEILAHTVDETSTHIGSYLRSGIGGDIYRAMGGKTKRAMLSEPNCVGSADSSVS